MNSLAAKTRAVGKNPLRAVVQPKPRARRVGPLRLLIGSHSHPQLSNGGAEIAAFELFTALRDRPQFDAWFLGCIRSDASQKLGATISQPYSEREYLYAVAAFDWFKFSNADAKFPAEFRALLELLQPDIVHFHHYSNFGVEAFLHVRETLPNCKIVLTLHEYLAICNHFGQMVTTQNRTLCYESGPVQCARCFSDISSSDFFLRTLYIQRFFELVDRFVAPSQFLAERYIAWGIPRNRIATIENVVAEPAKLRGPVAHENFSELLRVGFFGQISALKGINVLFEAAAILERRDEHNVVFEIYGDHTNQPPEFQTDFLERLAKAGHNVRFCGPYDRHRVDSLMQSVDLILIPSIWWENSPVVIQEALRNRRPVVCSDVGGMAEKVRDGLDGFHFPVGNSVALASLLVQIATTPSKLEKIRRTMRSPASADEVAGRYSQLYDSLL